MNLFKTAQLFVVALGLTLAVASSAEARNCVKGKPCGNSCISKNDVCHKGFLNDSAVNETSAVRSTTSGSTTANEPSITSHRTPAASEPINVPAVRQQSAKHCSKGKACGNSCIRMDAVCRE